MCSKRSRNGLRSFGSGFARRVASVLFLLCAVSPLWAADWAFLKEQAQDVSVSTVSQAVVQEVQEVQELASIQPVSQEPTKVLSTASTESSVNKLPELLTQLTELEVEEINSCDRQLEERFDRLKDEVGSL